MICIHKLVLVDCMDEVEKLAHLFALACHNFHVLFIFFCCRRILYRRRLSLIQSIIVISFKEEGRYLLTFATVLLMLISIRYMHVSTVRVC